MAILCARVLVCLLLAYGCLGDVCVCVHEWVSVSQEDVVYYPEQILDSRKMQSRNVSLCPLCPADCPLSLVLRVCASVSALLVACCLRVHFAELFMFIHSCSLLF